MNRGRTATLMVFGRLRRPARRAVYFLIFVTMASKTPAMFFWSAFLVG